MEVTSREGVPSGEVGETDERVHQGELARVIEFESGDAFAIRQPRGFRELAQLAAVDEGFEDVLLHREIAIGEPKYQALVSMPPVRFESLPRMIPERGIYLFSVGSQHLYVGRANGIRKRLQNHYRISGTHFTATFAALTDVMPETLRARLRAADCRPPETGRRRQPPRGRETPSTRPSLSAHRHRPRCAPRSRRLEDRRMTHARNEYIIPARSRITV